MECDNYDGGGNDNDHNERDRKERLTVIMKDNENHNS